MPVSEPTEDLGDRERKFQHYFNIVEPRYQQLHSDTAHELLLQAFDGPLQKRHGSIPPKTNIEIPNDGASGSGMAMPAVLVISPPVDFESPSVHGPGWIEVIVNAFKNPVPARDWTKSYISAPDFQVSGFEDDAFDIGLVNFSIGSFVDSAIGMKELFRTLKPGGIAIVSNWETFGVSNILDAAMRKVRADAAPLPVVHPEFRQEDTLVKTLVEAGFGEDEVEVCKTSLVLDDEEALDAIRDSLTGMYTLPVLSILSADETNAWPNAVAQTIEEAKVADRGVLCTAWVLTASKSRDIKLPLRRSDDTADNV